MSFAGGGGGLGGFGGIRVGIGRAIDEVPFTVKNTGRFWGKELEETTRKVETTVRASRTLVHNGCNGTLSAERDADLLEAVGAGVSITVLLNDQGQTTIFASEMEGMPTGVFKATIKSLSTLYLPQAPL